MKGISGLVLIVVQISLKFRRVKTPEKLAPVRLLIAIAGLGLFFAVAQPAIALDASPSAILTNPDGFDGKSVTIHGTITNLHETVSRRGNSYYTLDLSDGKQAIRVFSSGKAPCRAGTATVRNEVTATQVTCP